MNTKSRMKNMTNGAVALLFLIVFVSTNSTFAQELRSMGKTERIDGKLYLVADGKSSRIGEDVVVVKLKPGVSETDSSLNVIRKSRLGYIDLKVPEGKNILEFIDELDKRESRGQVFDSACNK